MTKLDLETDNTSRRQVGEVSAAEGGADVRCSQLANERPHQRHQGHGGRRMDRGVWKRGPFLQRPENMSASRYFATVQRPESYLCTLKVGPPFVLGPLVSGSSGTAGRDHRAVGLDGTSNPTSPGGISSWEAACHGIINGEKTTRSPVGYPARSPHALEHLTKLCFEIPASCIACAEFDFDQAPSWSRSCACPSMYSMY